MDVPLRALSWATRFFWIIALAFAATCIYSASLIRVGFGEPSVEFLDEFTVTLPVTFENGGYYDIADLNITTIILDNERRQLSIGTTHRDHIFPQENATVFHNVGLDLDWMMTQPSLLFEDSNLTLQGSINLRYANLIPFGFESNSSIPWGAPLSNFTVTGPMYSPYNQTHLRVEVPISFDNHSPYIEIAGTLQAQLFDDQAQLIGRNTTLVDVPSYESYDGQIEMFVDTSIVTNRGQIHVFVETEMLSYGPLVIDFG